jgi:hypothetical protein
MTDPTSTFAGRKTQEPFPKEGLRALSHQANKRNGISGWNALRPFLPEAYSSDSPILLGTYPNRRSYSALGFPFAIACRSRAVIAPLCCLTALQSGLDPPLGVSRSKRP